MDDLGNLHIAGKTAKNLIRVSFWACSTLKSGVGHDECHSIKWTTSFPNRFSSAVRKET